jgi:hypothetical protein
VLFDVAKDGDKLASMSVVPEDQQENNESRRLWMKLTEAISNKDMDGATSSKTEVEEAQREHRKKLEEKGEKHVPRFFEEKNGSWVPKLECVPSHMSSSSLLVIILTLFITGSGSRRDRRRKMWTWSRNGFGEHLRHLHDDILHNSLVVHIAFISFCPVITRNTVSTHKHSKVERLPTEISATTLKLCFSTPHTLFVFSFIFLCFYSQHTHAAILSTIQTTPGRQVPCSFTRSADF